MEKKLTGLNNRVLSRREEAAIYLHVFGGVDDWALLYRIAHPGEFERDPAKSEGAMVSTWKNSTKITRCRERIMAQFQDHISDEINAVKDTIFAGAEDDMKAGSVDYTKPENQKRKLNAIIAGATDPGEALDALKVIISGQRADSQAAKEGRQVRAYLPLLCYQCPLYKEKR